MTVKGADELVFLDITATHEARDIVIDMVRRVADTVFIPFTVGGGIRTVDDMRAILLAGADKVSINSAAVKQSRTDHARRHSALAASASSWPSMHASARAMTCWHAGLAGMCLSPAGASIPGWTPWHGHAKSNGVAPAKSCLPQWMATGQKKATMLRLTRAISDAVSIPVIASGGAGNPDHFVQALTAGGAAAALAASLFHFQELTIQQVKDHLQQAGVAVRMPVADLL